MAAKTSLQRYAEAALLGVAIGDALGVPVEFESREYLDENPVTDMIGYGTYNKPAGTWSDDTALTLALADSLAQGSLDYYDIMTRFASWLQQGTYTTDGVVFDVGNATRAAIERSASGTEPLLCGGSSDRDNGNGSLMRILPLFFYLKANYGSALKEESVEIIHDVSALTHAHPRSKVACVIYCAVAEKLCEGFESGDAIASALHHVIKHHENEEFYAKELKHFKCVSLLDDSPHIEEQTERFAALPRAEVASSGYVIHTLDAALWCLLNYPSFEEAVLAAVNLGEDTDTTAAVLGGLAGIRSVQANQSPKESDAVIPKKWIQGLTNLPLFTDISTRFVESLNPASAH